MLQTYECLEGWGTQLSPNTENQVLNEIEQVEQRVVIDQRTRDEVKQSELLQQGTGRDFSKL